MEHSRPPARNKSGMTPGPTPPAVFVGRERERARILEALAATTPMAAIIGLAGAGKSALAAACAARWSGPVVEIALDGEPDGWARLDGELRRASDDRQALVLIDAVDRIPPAERAAFVAMLARRLGRSRAILTSRERLPIADGHDRFEVRLRGLRLGAARRLWQELDTSYGKQVGFAAAWRASAGHPGLLRRAHAGGAAGDSPLHGTVGELPPDQLALLSALAVARVPIPAAALDSLIEGDAEAATSALHRALLIDRDGAGACTADELVRELLEGLLREADADIRSLHARLPPVLARAGLDQVSLARETTYHLGRAGEWDQAAAELAGMARGLVEQGSSAELLHCLVELPPGAETPALAVWRVRCRLRLLELREGEAEARRALDHPCAHRRELLLLLARLLFLRGALDEAERVMAEAAAEPSVSARDEASLAMLAATVRCYRDQVPAACVDLDAAAARLPEQAGKLRATAAALRWLDHHGARPPDAPSPEPTVRGVGLRAAALLSVATSEIGGAPSALVLETDSALRLSEEKLRRHRDMLSRVHVSAVRAVRLWERGRRLDALVELESTAESARRLEYHVAALWLDVWTARALFGLGRSVAAEAVLAGCAAHAERIGARWLLRAAASARAQDPVARLVTQIRRDDAAGDGAPLRGGAHAMLAAAARGDAARAEALHRGIAGELDRPGFGVERALVALARATLEEGSPDGAAGRARDELRADGGDADLVDWLAAVARDLMAVSSPRAAVEEEAEVVLDGETGELRAPSLTVPFARRHVLRRLLFRMAERPGEAVSKDELAQAAWGVRYHPLRHDNALFVNIHRLRALLGGTGVGVVSWEAGYSLSAPPGFRFLVVG